jgi:hypothetical protein
VPLELTEKPASPLLGLQAISFVGLLLGRNPDVYQGWHYAAGDGGAVAASKSSLARL